MLILQRLGGGQTLDEIVSQIVGDARDLLPDNKRVRERTLSENSGAYSRTRQRLPVEFIWELKYRWRWTPSVKDRRSYPELPADASLDVLFYEVRIPGDKSLYLVSNLDWDAPTTATAYQRRYDVEFDIRDIKVTVDVEKIRAKSVEMFQKELCTSIMAYNLAMPFRRQAAKLAGVPPRRLRFKGVWTTLTHRLLMKPMRSLSEWLERYDEALAVAAKKKHP